MKSCTIPFFRIIPSQWNDRWKSPWWTFFPHLFIPTLRQKEAPGGASFDSSDFSDLNDGAGVLDSSMDVGKVQLATRLRASGPLFRKLLSEALFDKTCKKIQQKGKMNVVLRFSLLLRELGWSYDLLYSHPPVDVRSHQEGNLEALFSGCIFP